MTLRPRFAFSHPAHAIALGFGAGLAPVAPGTMGTLLGWAIASALADLSPALMLGLVFFFFAVGLWACDVTGRHLGVSDHSGMVWDEVVAFLLILAIIGFFVDPADAQGRFMDQITALVGPQGGEAMRAMVEQARPRSRASL